MNSVEERLREALRAHAEEFTAHPDAWRQLTARRHRRGRARSPRWSRFPGPALIPLAAAAAVILAVAAAILVVHGVSGRAGQAPVTGATATAQSSSPPPSPSSSPTASVSDSPEPVLSAGGAPPGPSLPVLTMHPALSAVVHVRVPWIGKQVHGRAEQVTSYFWLSRNSPAFWPDQVNPGLQLCNGTTNDTTGQSLAFCWPAPAPGPAHLATVTGSGGAGTDQTIMVGQAVARVASVTAVLADGRTYAGAVTTGRGLSGTVWAVGYPWSAGVPFTRGAHLVFRDASGQPVAVLTPHAPSGPPQTAQPASGGVALFSYPAGHNEPAGTVRAYLVRGEVGFWSPVWGGAISQQAAAAGPAVGGLTESFVIGPGGTFTRLVALGYAHAGVARVVLRADGRQLASAATRAAGWPGSGLRLWDARVPLDPQQVPMGKHAITAIAYDQAGHVLGQARLGQLA